MAQCCRVFLNLLHCIIAVDALFVLVYSMVTFNSKEECLLPMVGNDGLTIPFHARRYFCDGIIYSSAFICVLHLFMCLFLNCSWENDGIIILNILMSLLSTLASTFSGVVYTLYWLLWCDSLTNWMPTTHDYQVSTCQSAAQEYDLLHHSTNVSSFSRRLIVQQATNFALVPLGVILIVAYTIVVRIHPRSESTTSREQDPQVHYVVIQDDTAPLLGRDPPPAYTTDRLGDSNVNGGNNRMINTILRHREAPMNSQDAPNRPQQTSTTSRQASVNAQRIADGSHETLLRSQEMFLMSQEVPPRSQEMSEIPTRSQETPVRSTATPIRSEATPIRHEEDIRVTLSDLQARAGSVSDTLSHLQNTPRPSNAHDTLSNPQDNSLLINYNDTDNPTAQQSTTLTKANDTPMTPYNTSTDSCNPFNVPISTTEGQGSPLTPYASPDTFYASPSTIYGTPNTLYGTPVTSYDKTSSFLDTADPPSAIQNVISGSHFPPSDQSTSLLDTPVPPYENLTASQSFQGNQTSARKSPTTVKLV